MNKSWIFHTPLLAVLRLASPCNESLSSVAKTLRVGQLLLHVQTEEIDFKNVFLQPDVRLHSRNTVVLLDRSCNILWPFVRPFWRHSATFLSRLLIEIQQHQHRRCSTLH
jgi:hypothetical protein